MFLDTVLLFLQYGFESFTVFSKEKWSCLKKRTLQIKQHDTEIEIVDNKKTSDGRLIAAKRLKERLTPHHPKLEWVIQPQGLLIEKLSAMRCHTQTHVHMCPLSCSRMSPVLMKHSPYPLPSLSLYSHKVSLVGINQPG